MVEDNELNREIAQFILEHTGITVVNAENGKEAVEIFKASEQGEFDFILMDVMMPVMDGIELSRHGRTGGNKDHPENGTPGCSADPYFCNDSQCFFR